MLVFISEREVPTTIKVSGQALRMSAVFRNATNGFRADWGAELYGGARTAAATRRQQGFTVLAALRTPLEDASILPPPPAPCAE